jgi:ribonuclease HII
MKTEFEVPIIVADSINNWISTNHKDLTQKQRTSLFTKIVSLWFYIDIRSKHADKMTEINGAFADISTKTLTTFNWSKAIDGRKDKIPYQTFLRVLEEINLIDINKSYKVGTFTKSYRTRKVLWHITRKVVIDCKVFIKETKSIEELVAKNPLNEKLVNTLFTVKIDMDDLNERITKGKGKMWRGSILTNDRINEILLAALKINLGIHWATTSNEGRFYSSLTSLPTFCLPSIIGYDYEIDATNCGMSLLSKWMPKEWKDAAQRGQIYEEIAEEINKTRDEVKEMMAALIFMKDPISGKIASTLNKLYPNSVDRLNDLKEEWNGDLWKPIQELEASIWISVAREEPYNIITRHDSVLISKSFRDMFMKKLRDKYTLNDIIAPIKIKKL